MDRKALTKSIIIVVNGIINDSGYEMMIADQSAPRPSEAYGTVKIISMPQETLESVQYGQTSGYLSSSQHRVMVSFNFFKDGSFEQATVVRRALWRQDVADQLQEIGLGLSQRGTVENLTESLEAVFEERASFICTFNYVEIDSDAEYDVDANSIENTNVHGTVEQIETVYPIEIEIKEN